MGRLHKPQAQAGVPDHYPAPTAQQENITKYKTNAKNTLKEWSVTAGADVEEK